MSDRVIPKSMMAVVTTGNGGYEKLEYRSVPVPVLQKGQVLIRVLAAGMNNTEINTRLGWYSSSVSESTDAFGQEQQQAQAHKQDGGWNNKTPFPMIQGTDCCGEVVQISEERHASLLSKRVLVRACMRVDGFDQLETSWMASDFDGAFAGYVAVPADEVFAVNCQWSDAELATIPCAYATAETMLARTQCSEGDKVLITGASGGVGSAAIQLAKRRGAHVSAVTTMAKAESVRAIGADQIFDRHKDLQSQTGENAFDLVVDNVAGSDFPALLKAIRRGGRYTSSGAIAGPIVSLDMRDMYLKDITLIGTTAWDEAVFPDIISYIEQGEIRPLLAKTFPLKEIAAAQEEFAKKAFVGNFVLIP